VGPIWHGGKRNEPERLAECYRNSLRLAVESGVKTIAFPSISTGVYRFPIKMASRIAIREVRQFLEGNATLERVIFVCFSAADYGVYEEALAAT